MILRSCIFVPCKLKFRIKRIKDINIRSHSCTFSWWFSS